ncbi:hypothetical protein [Maritalea sp.]|uniref:hypothetical protein n=1 Tax=Maritalea sp. TaxID=2003361 RepID=UPI0039E634BF
MRGCFFFGSGGRADELVKSEPIDATTGVPSTFLIVTALYVGYVAELVAGFLVMY